MKLKYIIMSLAAIFAANAWAGTPDWMAQLPDTMKVRNVSIPGSHDAATSGTALAKTQSYDIAGQWDRGVRAFDLRPRENGQIYHGSTTNTNVTMQQVFTTLKEKLTGSDEFAVVVIRLERDNPDNYMAAFNTMMQGIEEDYSDYIADFNPSMKVKQARGKIIILTRTKYDSDKAAYLEGWHELTNIDDIKNNAVRMKSERTRCRLYLQDYYQVSNSGTKTSLISGLLNYAADTENYPSWIINHTAGYTGSLGITSSYQSNASTTNPHCANELKEIDGRVGIIMMDFAGDPTYGGEELVNAIIAQNPVYVYATKIAIDELYIDWPSIYSKGSTVDAITLGETLKANISLTPSTTNDAVTSTSWTVEGADGLEINIDNTGNMTINTENATVTSEDGEVTITFTVGRATYDYNFTLNEVNAGDVNLNGKPTVADVVCAANYAAKIYNLDAFCFPNANVITTPFNGEQVINGQDISGIINIVIGRNETSGARAVKREAIVIETNDRLVVDNFQATGQETTIAVKLDNTYKYSTLQASVIIPAGMTVKGVTAGPRAASHSLVSNIMEGEVNVVIYSMSNASFLESDEALFFLHVVANEGCEGLSLQDINAADANCNGYILGFDGGLNEAGTTGIQDIDVDGDVRYYDLNGVEVKNPDKGIYIRIENGVATKVVR